MPSRHFPAALLALCLAALPALAVDPAQVPEEKRTKLGLYVDGKEALELKKSLGAKALFLDVRTKAEVQYVGTATAVDAVVPLVELSPGGEWDEKKSRLLLVPQKDFVAGVTERLAAAGLSRSDPVILICRSGDRSARAVDELAAAGYTKVYTVIDGFEGDLSKDGRRDVNGWKNAGLPWTYKVTKDQVVRTGGRPPNSHSLVPGR
jgi:rhodanese-related sulfurtransferase